MWKSGGLCVDVNANVDGYEKWRFFGERRRILYVGQESEARNEGASLKKLENWSKSGLIKSVNTTI